MKRTSLLCWILTAWFLFALHGRAVADSCVIPPFYGSYESGLDPDKPSYPLIYNYTGNTQSLVGEAAFQAALNIWEGRIKFYQGLAEWDLKTVHIPEINRGIVDGEADSECSDSENWLGWTAACTNLIRYMPDRIRARNIILADGFFVHIDPTPPGHVDFDWMYDDSQWTAGNWDKLLSFKSVMTHEIGHGVGAAHTSNDCAEMSPCTVVQACLGDAPTMHDGADPSCQSSSSALLMFGLPGCTDRFPAQSLSASEENFLSRVYGLLTDVSPQVLRVRVVDGETIVVDVPCGLESPRGLIVELLVEEGGESIIVNTTYASWSVGRDGCGYVSKSEIPLGVTSVRLRDASSFEDFGVFPVDWLDKLNITGVYPNPFVPLRDKGIYLVGFPYEDVDAVEIYTIQGQLVLKHRAIIDEDGTLRLPIKSQDLATGIYLIGVRSRGELKQAGKLMVLK